MKLKRDREETVRKEKPTMQATYPMHLLAAASQHRKDAFPRNGLIVRAPLFDLSSIHQDTSVAHAHDLQLTITVVLPSVPSRPTCPMASNTVFWFSSSNALVHSSRASTTEGCASARAICRNCACPPEMRPAFSRRAHRIPWGDPWRTRVRSPTLLLLACHRPTPLHCHTECSW